MMAVPLSLTEHLNRLVPLHLLVPAIIIVITLLAAGALVNSSAIKDIYEPKEKPIITVEEVSEIPAFLFYHHHCYNRKQQQQQGAD